MKSITLQIGNSDDKLTQLQWSEFVRSVDDAIAAYDGRLHFSGGSASSKPWQNYCWVFEFEDCPLKTNAFTQQLSALRAHYEQDSIAWLEGETQFI